MRRYFEDVASKSIALVLFFFAFWIFLGVFAWLVPGDLIDTMPGYSYDDVIMLMGVYGEEGRTTYAWSSLTIDTLIPISYVSFLAGLIYRFRLTESTWFLAYLPIVGGVMDLLENLQITTMLLQFPDFTEAQVDWSSTCTLAKTYISQISMLLAVVLVVVSLTKRGITTLRS